MSTKKRQRKSASPSPEQYRDLLHEYREATQVAEQHQLFEFASMLLQLLDIPEAATLDDNERGDIDVLISDGVDEIKAVIESGDASSGRLEELHELTVDRWGDFLTHPDDVLDDGWGMVDVEAESCDQQDDPEIPTAEQVQALLSSLAGSATDPSDRPETPEPKSDVHAPPPASPMPAHQDPSNESIHSLDGELREAFLDDAQSCVGSMENALLQLERQPDNADALTQICRDLHTLKGASGSVGLSKLAGQLHELEDRLRADQAASRAPDVDSLLRDVDSVRLQIWPPQEERAASPADRVDSAASHKPTNSPAPAAAMTSFVDAADDDESVRVKSSQLNRLMDMLAELVMLRNRRETELSELQDVYHELIGSVSKMRMISNEQTADEISTSSLQLEEVASDVLEVAQNVRDCARPVADGNAAVSQFIRQFRTELVQLRRSPISGLFRRLQRAVRDAAHAEGKEVHLNLVGEESGMERSLQQRLYEPLLHIVRNSVCHGIENPVERTQQGKDSAGTITLEAKSGADLFVIEIRDDGRGLDYDAIRRRGIESGLIAADQAVSREELSQLIFHPGFSTRKVANQVAGRGVGMDVVATTLQRMHGWIEVESEPSQGTRIRLSFSLPSVIQHVMVFRSAGQLFAIPMQSVKLAGGQQDDSRYLTFSDLVARGGSDSTGKQQRIVLACPSSGSTESRRGGSVTMLVDEIVGPEEVVVRPLPRIMRNHPFCCGATLSSMGDTVLLLDARRIVDSQQHRLRDDDLSGDKRPEGQEEARATGNQVRVLVVDDSLSARKRVVRSLRRYGVQIVEASDGKQALNLLKKQSFDAVFSDMEMPHVSGMELLAEITSCEATSATPVVIISSRGEPEFTDRAKELGVTSYLLKPVDDQRLDQALSLMPALQHLTGASLTSIPLGETR